MFDKKNVFFCSAKVRAVLSDHAFTLVTLQRRKRQTDSRIIMISHP